MKAIIAGGGIGGLVAALCLHRAGVEVKVYESVSEIQPLGVGINLLPHSVKILSELGLDAELAATGIATDQLLYLNKFGQLIWREPRGLAAGYQWPQYSIHRGRLQLLLLAAVRKRIGTDAVITGCHLEFFENHGDKVEARFIDRQTGETSAEASGSILIGAEGIHSRVRKVFYPEEKEPRFSGRLLWRGVTEAEPFLTGRSMFMAGYADRKFVAYPICPHTANTGRSLVNWVADVFVGDAYAGTQRDWNREVCSSRVLEHFINWKFDSSDLRCDIPALISGAEKIFEFPMIDRDPLLRWSFGRVTLLGDAAHPMYPIGSNGASQAIVDASVLAESLGTENDVLAALKRYESERLPATSRIVLSNREQGPEKVMQIVEERAPNGFKKLSDVASYEELYEIVERYRQIAGFQRAELESQTGNKV